jgi:type IV pilus assembly protein PilB
MKSFGERIADILIEDGLLENSQLDEILEIQKTQGGRLLKLLLDKRYVTEQDMMISMGRCLGTPPVNLARMKITKEVLDLVPKDISKNHQMIPIARLGNVLYVAMADPLNVLALDELKQITKMEIVPMISTEKAVQDAMAIAEASSAAGMQDILAEAETDGTVVEMTDEGQSDVTEEDPTAAPVIKIANMMLATSVKDKCSDIHLECYEKNLKLRYRVDGSLYDYPPPPKSMQNALISRLKIMAKLDISEKRLPQDGRIRIKMSGKEFDFRASFLPTIHGEKVVLRLLDKSGLAPNIDSIGMDKASSKKFMEALDAPHGMMLVTGPTGSGKTTTLYSALAHLNQSMYNIVTVEDPVEYQLNGINQVQVKPEIGYDFAAALRSILRQDPDIVMIGEIRDNETADIAVKAALTGHQVLTTLHTNDAAGAITRLIDMDIEPFLVASSVTLSCAQRLMRRICNHCKEPVQVPTRLIEQLGMDHEEARATKFYKGHGCDYCKNTGFAGRLAVLELILITEEIRQLVIQRKAANEIKTAALQQGMQTLRQNAIDKARQGYSTLEEALAITMADY